MNIDILNFEDLFFKEIEKYSIEEQNERLKTELRAIITENQDLRRQITFLQSQISKFEGLIQ